MNKKKVAIIIIIVLITLGFLFGILAITDRQKGYPPGLELGNNFSYWYDGMIFGKEVPNQAVHGELYAFISGYNPLLKLIDIYTINHWSNMSSGTSTDYEIKEMVRVSEYIPTFPLISERNSSLGGIGGQVSGEFFGWILPRDYYTGMFINNFIFEKEESKSTAAGTFYTQVFTKANITKENDILVTSLTKLYYEKWSGVLVYAENMYTVFNTTSTEFLFFEFEYILLTVFSDYKWPAMTYLMPILGLAQPIVEFFSTYAFFVLVILLIIALAVLWKKSSAYR